ncbi:HAD-IA family hydrolase [Actinomyces israelii]|uniref:HAD-IA family hydrolase n=1 Tax=Actinomyces israelii TaxID=1659 RepID=A0ABT4I7Y1_9ACTO|nr:HAD-IA family hydrolase [Actinomyces israelii]MCZ0857626.1 HAD-IA family hydrolase [Actinomyces israelii]
MKHIIWDMGGTLIDTYPEVVRALSRAAYGDTDPSHLREIGALTQHSIAHAIESLSVSREVPRADLERAYEELKTRWRTRPAPVMDGARELIARVWEKGGLNLVATHRDRASATMLVTVLGLDLDDMVCAPDGPARKPSPEMNLLLARRHGLDPTQVLCVGDRPIDAVAAANAGMNAALLVSPGTVLTLRDAVDGTAVVASLRDLIPFF